MDEQEGFGLMAARRTVLVVEIDRDALSVAEIARAGERVTVLRTLCEGRPAEIDPGDAGRMGRWVGERLEAAGIARGWAILTLARRDVVLKRLEAPAEVSEGELDSLVRLQMSRQVAVASQSAVVDYAELGRQGAGGSEQRVVIAGALPGDRLAWLRTLGESAGLRWRQIRLLASGIEPMLAGRGERTGQTLAIALGRAAAEIVVLDGGRPVFARSAEIARADEGQALDAYAERIAVETKRTWMGYRVSPGAQEIEAIAVLGDGELERRVSRRCEEALEISGRTIPTPGWVDGGAGGLDGSLLALVGVSVTPAGMALDFANPRTVADPMERRRRAALLGVLGLILVAGAGFVLAQGEIGRLRDRAAILRGKNAEYRKQYAEYLKLSARASHAGAWLGASTDWAGHLAYLSERLPEPEFGLVNSISGSLEGGEVVFEGTGSGLQGEWRVPAVARFSFSGSSAREGLLTELRARLLEPGVYRVRTIGADVGDRYALELSTGELSPGEGEADLGAGGGS